MMEKLNSEDGQLFIKVGPSPGGSPLWGANKADICFVFL